jgi:hypothetical protein
MKPGREGRIALDQQRTLLFGSLCSHFAKASGNDADIVFTHSADNHCPTDCSPRKSSLHAAILRAQLRRK